MVVDNVDTLCCMGKYYTTMKTRKLPHLSQEFSCKIAMLLWKKVGELLLLTKVVRLVILM